MFLNKLIKKNPILIDESVNLYNKGLIQADSYVIDLDCLLENARKILDKAKVNDIRLFFMLKQLGRNPYIAKKLVEIGYEGAVVVDFKEALTMMKNNIPISNVGHLVQTPKNLIKDIMEYGSEFFTVYSYEKLLEINKIAKELNICQKIMLKVSGKNDIFYSGQYSGIELEALEEFIEKSKSLKNIKIEGITAFPCYLYNYDTNEIDRTANYYTVVEACKILKSLDIDISYIDTPSTTSILTLEKMKDDIGNIGEPGHGLTGSTPAHSVNDLDELPCVLYITEISHNFRNKSYAYGGGYYRRGHVKNCLIVNKNDKHLTKVNPISNDSIDYYFELDKEEKISSIVIMAFRFQIFVTRSNLVIIEGLSKSKPKIVGTYNSLGDEVYE